MTIPPTALDQFKTTALKAVKDRDEDGTISPQASIILHFRMMDEVDRLAAKLWLNDEVKAAVTRLDINASRAWVAVMDRIKGH